MESLLTDESSPVWVVRYMSEQEAETLIELCTEKLGKDPSSYRALLLRATAYVKKGNFVLALEDYNAMLHFNPKSESCSSQTQSLCSQPLLVLPFAFHTQLYSTFSEV